MELSIAMKFLTSGLPVDPLPSAKKRNPLIAHAPVRRLPLTDSERQSMMRDALRYFQLDVHSALRDEFNEELDKYGHIYMYRLYPDFIEMKAHPLDAYPAKCKEAAALMAVIMNSLDHRIAQYPQELIANSTDGYVFCNWAQFWLAMHFLAIIDADQTLTITSGHPSGVFPSFASSPRVVISNTSQAYATSGSEQRLSPLSTGKSGRSYNVLDTYITLVNAGRKLLGEEKLTGKVFVTSGLGALSGAQGKAIMLSECIGVIAEIDLSVLQRRKSQGWIDDIVSQSNQLLNLISECKEQKRSLAIGFHGNIVDLWEIFVSHYEATGVNLVDLATDQISPHNMFNGGHHPYQISVEEADKLRRDDASAFEQLVKESLRKQVHLIDKLVCAGTKFWDNGKALSRVSAQAKGQRDEAHGISEIDLKYPSHVQHILASMLDMGFAPFHWICMSQDIADLREADATAERVLNLILRNQPDLPMQIVTQYRDNIEMLEKCRNDDTLIIGSLERTLYVDQVARILIAGAFNRSIASGKLKGPIVISRDHFNVSSVDGGNSCSDMSLHNFVGNSIRGATWVFTNQSAREEHAIHSGYGLLLDGSDEVDRKAKCLLSFDVSDIVSRKSWAGNKNAITGIERIMKSHRKLLVARSSSQQLSQVINSNDGRKGAS